MPLHHTAQKPEVREAARKAALQAGKDKKKAAEEKKKSDKVGNTSQRTFSHCAVLRL